jgi:hypothetical protein
MTLNFLLGARTTVAIGALVCSLGLASTPVAARQASAGVTESSDVAPTAGATVANIQQQITLTCPPGTPGTCAGNFQALTVKQSLRLQKVVCFISTGNNVTTREAYVRYVSPLFYYDLALRSRVDNGFGFSELFDEDAAFTVPKGRTLQRP